MISNRASRPVCVQGLYGQCVDTARPQAHQERRTACSNPTGGAQRLGQATPHSVDSVQEHRVSIQYAFPHTVQCRLRCEYAWKHELHMHNAYLCKHQHMFMNASGSKGTRCSSCS